MQYHFEPSITELDLSGKNITSLKQIINLYELINLKTLNLSYNKISKIEGLEHLTKLQTLNLSNNEISKIEGLENLVALQTLNLDRNQISKIERLNNLVALRILNLYNNQINKIEGLYNLINLQILDLGNNKINKIKGLENLVILQSLFLYQNQISKIEGLENLVTLQILNLYNNKINKIEGLDNLTHLQKLSLYTNQITELPLELCNFRNIQRVYYSDNPIEHIPLPVQRWLDRLNRRVTRNNMIYNNNQNIHNYHIQNSFRLSLSNILKDKDIYELDFIKQHIVDNEILTRNTKQELFNYIESQEEHSIYLITYSDLLRYVYTRIINNDNKDNLLKILNDEISDSSCMCFTGRMTRLLNVLNGFYNDIEIQISDSEQITNIIMSLKRVINETELKEAVKQELTERQFSIDIINEWLEYI